MPDDLLGPALELSKHAAFVSILRRATLECVQALVKRYDVSRDTLRLLNAPGDDGCQTTKAAVGILRTAVDRRMPAWLIEHYALEGKDVSDRGLLLSLVYGGHGSPDGRRDLLELIVERCKLRAADIKCGPKQRADLAKTVHAAIVGRHGGKAPAYLEHWFE